MLDIHGFVNITTPVIFSRTHQGERLGTSTGDYCMNGITRPESESHLWVAAQHIPCFRAELFLVRPYGARTRHSARAPSARKPRVADDRWSARSATAENGACDQKLRELVQGPYRKGIC